MGKTSFKIVESPSTTRLEARFAYYDSRAGSAGSPGLATDGSRRSNLEPEQRGQGGYTHSEREADPVWLRHCDLRYADDTTLMAESEEELKSLLMKVQVETENSHTGSAPRSRHV